MDHQSIIDIHPKKKGSVKISSKSSSSSEDERQLEMMWTEKQEIYINDIKDECIKNSIKHYNRYNFYMYTYNILSIPMITIPLLLSGLDKYIESDYIKTCLLCFVGILNSILTFSNLGQRFEKHLECRNKYIEFSTGIEIEIIKPKKYRESVEVYLEKIKYKLVQLNENSPK